MREQALNHPRAAGPAQGGWQNNWIAGALMALLVFGWPSGASAAEVQQVRGADLLQLGDGNRSYSVELVCLQMKPDQRPAAEAWLRERLPRRTRVNLRPMGQRQGVLLARVNRLDSESDLSTGLIDAGLAQAAPCPGEPIAALVAPELDDPIESAR